MSGQPTKFITRGRFVELGALDELAGGVRELGITRPVVDRGDAVLGEQDTSGPAEFRSRGDCPIRSSCATRGCVRFGAAAGDALTMSSSSASSSSARVCASASSNVRGRVAAVHDDLTAIGDDIVGNTCFDPHDLERLLVVQPVDRSPSALRGRRSGRASAPLGALRSLIQGRGPSGHAPQNVPRVDVP